MLARQLINATLKGLTQPEIIAVQGQNLTANNSIEYPVRQVYLYFSHSPRVGVSDNSPAVDQAEVLFDFFLVGRYVGLNARTAETVQRGLKLFIAAPIRVAI